MKFLSSMLLSMSLLITNPLVAETKTPSNVVEITHQSFAKEIKRKEPIILMVYTDWCHYCKIMKPIVNELSIEYDGKVKFLKINADRNPIEGVKSYPTFIFIKNGVPLRVVPGAMNKKKFKEILKAHIGE